MQAFHAADKRPPYFTFARQRGHFTASAACRACPHAHGAVYFWAWVGDRQAGSKWLHCFSLCAKKYELKLLTTFRFLQSLYQANLAPYSTFSARRTKCAKSALRQVSSRKIRRRLEANCKLLHCDLQIIFARSKNFCTRSLDKDFMYI